MWIPNTLVELILSTAVQDPKMQDLLKYKSKKMKYDTDSSSEDRNFSYPKSVPKIQF